MRYIGIDLGGSKIEAASFDPGGRLLARQRLPLPRADYPGTLRAVAHLVEAVREGAPDYRVGIATPGFADPASGRMQNCYATPLLDRPFQVDLEALLQCPVRIANDANCFALSESIDGAARGARVVFGLILGTGCGGGIVIDGQPLVGHHAIAGEWGHIPLPLPTAEDLPLPTCSCGRAGCIEAYVSGTGLANDHRATTGASLSAQDIGLRAAQGDVACAASLARLERRLGRALAVVINLLDPDCIVVGGGLSRLDSLYRNVPSSWHPWVYGRHVHTPFLRNHHGDASGVRGAAWLWR